MARTDVKFKLTAQNDTEKAFRSVSQSLTKLRKNANMALGRVAKMGVAFSAVAGGAMVALTKRSLENVDALAKTADKLGITTDALVGLQHAAKLSGVSTNTMNMALQRMGRRVAEAAKGTGEAKGALQELGISAASLQKMPLDKQMEVIADRMNGVETQTDRVRLAMKLFDSEGVALVNTLRGGSDGLRKAAAEAEQLGIAINRVDAAKIEQANDAVTRAQSVFTGLGNQLATAFSPIIQQVATDFYQSALDANEFGNVGNRVARSMVTAIGYIGNSLRGLQAGWLALRMVVADYYAWALGHTENAVSGITAAWYKFTQLTAERLGKFFSEYGGVVAKLGEAWIGVKIVVADFYAWLFETMAEGARKFDGVIQGMVDAYNTVAEFFGKDTIEFNPAGNLDDISAAFKATANGFRDDLKNLKANPAEMTNGMAEAFAFTAEQIQADFDGIILDSSNVIGDLGDAFSFTANGFKDELDMLMSLPLPLDAAMEWFDQVQMKARETAEVTANAVAPTPSGDGEGEGITFQVPKIGDQFSKEFDSSIQLANDFTGTVSAMFDQMGVDISQSTMNTVSAVATIGSLTMQQMSTLANAFGEGSKAAKAFFVVNQAMAAGMAIVNAFQAGTAIRLAYAQMAAMSGNPALIAVGEAHAAAAQVMGFVSAAAILGQTAASFDGGGFTGDGGGFTGDKARTGGMDGKGGYPALLKGKPAILHGKEYIVDFTKPYAQEQAIEAAAMAGVDLQKNAKAFNGGGLTSTVNHFNNPIENSNISKFDSSSRNLNVNNLSRTLENTTSNVRNSIASFDTSTSDFTNSSTSNTQSNFANFNRSFDTNNSKSFSSTSQFDDNHSVINDYSVNGGSSTNTTTVVEQPVSVNLNITAADTRDFDRLLTERRGMIASLVTQAVNKRGRALA